MAENNAIVAVTPPPMEPPNLHTLPTELLEIIFEKLTASDLVNVADAVPGLQGAVNNSIDVRFLKGLSFVMKYLKLKDILKFRLISKKLKKSIDAFLQYVLIKDRPAMLNFPHVLPTNKIFQKTVITVGPIIDIILFLNDIRSYVPFIIASRSLAYQGYNAVGGFQYPRQEMWIISLLDTVGDGLLEFRMEFPAARVDRINLPLRHLLSRTTNIRNLQVSTESIYNRQGSEEATREFYEVMLYELPILNQLVELKLADIRDGYDSILMDRLVLNYGRQLESLECSGEYFRQIYKDNAMLDAVLPKVKHLSLFNLCKESLKCLAERCPKWELQTLKLLDGQNTEKFPRGLTDHVLAVLNRHSKTLHELTIFPGLLVYSVSTSEEPWLVKLSNIKHLCILDRRQNEDKLDKHIPTLQKLFDKFDQMTKLTLIIIPNRFRTEEEMETELWLENILGYRPPVPKVPPMIWELIPNLEQAVVLKETFARTWRWHEEIGHYIRPKCILGEEEFDD